MRLVELDEKLLEINQLKDIRSIDYKDLAIASTNGKIKIIPGFIVVYGTGHIIYLTNRDPHFEIFVKKIREAYKNEKDNIIEYGILGKKKIEISPLTKKILESGELENVSSEYQVFKDSDSYTESLLFEEDRVSAIFPIVEYHLIETLKLFDLTINNISISSGMNGNYFINAIINNLPTVLPVNFAQNSFNNFTFEIGNLFDKAESVNISITFYKNKIMILTTIDEHKYSEYVAYCFEDGLYCERDINLNGKEIYYSKDLMNKAEGNDYTNLISDSLVLYRLPWNAYFGISEDVIPVLEDGKIISTNVTYLSISDDRFYIREILSKYFNKDTGVMEKFQDVTLDSISRTTIGIKQESLTTIETAFDDNGITGFYKDFLAGKHFYQIAQTCDFSKIASDNTQFIGRNDGLIENVDLLEPKKYIKKAGDK